MKRKLYASVPPQEAVQSPAQVEQAHAGSIYLRPVVEFGHKEYLDSILTRDNGPRLPSSRVSVLGSLSIIVATKVS
jgi:hypothetical protein